MGPATDEEKAQGKKVALLASRANTVLSVPMLLFMGASHNAAALGMASIASQIFLG